MAASITNSPSSAAIMMSAQSQSEAVPQGQKSPELFDSARVYDTDYIINCDGCLCNIRGQHDLLHIPSSSVENLGLQRLFT